MNFLDLFIRNLKKKTFEAGREPKAHIKAKKDAQTKMRTTKRRVHKKIAIRGKTTQTALFYSFTSRSS